MNLINKSPDKVTGSKSIHRLGSCGSETPKQTHKSGRSVLTAHQSSAPLTHRNEQGIKSALKLALTRGPLSYLIHTTTHNTSSLSLPKWWKSAHQSSVRLMRKSFSRRHCTQGQELWFLWLCKSPCEQCPANSINKLQQHQQVELFMKKCE